jgi:phage baseplate assembly protein gpV
MNETQRVTIDGVAAEIPLGWRERSQDETKDYVSPDETEQVLISVLTFKNPQDATQIKSVISSQTAARQNSVVKASGGRAQLLPVKYDQPPAHGVTLVGADMTNGVLMCVRIAADAARLATISYYRYGNAGDVAGFLNTADPVCQSLRLVTQ